MAKSSKSPRPAPKNAGGKEGGYANGVPMKFVPRNLMGVNPLKEQFEPTAAEPVPQRYKMAGGC